MKRVTVLRKKSFSQYQVALPIMVAGLLLMPVMSSVAVAQETEGDTTDSTGIGTIETESMEPASFACENNPNPICDNPEHEITSESWMCSNNPGPDCAEPPRVEADLEPDSWACVNNQNVAICDNPIRYTVDDPESWTDRFSVVTNSDS